MPTTKPGEVFGYMTCECGGEVAIKRCKGERESYSASCSGCSSRRFLSPALVTRLEADKLVYDR